MQDAMAWDGNWAWSLPLIVVTIILHVIGMVLINERVTLAHRWLGTRRRFIYSFAMLMGAATLCAVILAGLEAIIWAGVFLALGALPDGKSAVLYSLNAMTSYGHVNIELADHWRLMGALEALNGMILFGLTTAFLYGMIQELLAARRS